MLIAARGHGHGCRGRLHQAVGGRRSGGYPHPVDLQPGLGLPQVLSPQVSIHTRIPANSAQLAMYTVNRP